MEKQVLLRRYQNHFDMLADAREKIKRNLWERKLITDAEMIEINQGLAKAESILADKWYVVREGQGG